MGEGNIILAGTIIDTEVEIGHNNALGFNIAVGHYSKIANHVTFSGGVIVNGGVEIGEGTFLGMGCILSPVDFAIPKVDSISLRIETFLSTMKPSDSISLMDRPNLGDRCVPVAISCSDTPGVLLSSLRTQ